MSEWIDFSVTIGGERRSLLCRLWRVISAPLRFIISLVRKD